MSTWEARRRSCGGLLAAPSVALERLGYTLHNHGGGGPGGRRSWPEQRRKVAMSRSWSSLI